MIFIDMSFNFLIQTTRVLQKGNYDEDELIMVYNFVSNLDNEILKDYFSTCTILSYETDLHLYTEILDALISIFEEKEEYEKCDILLKKKEQCYKIIEDKKI